MGADDGRVERDSSTGAGLAATFAGALTGALAAILAGLECGGGLVGHKWVVVLVVLEVVGGRGSVVVGTGIVVVGGAGWTCWDGRGRLGGAGVGQMGRG